MSYTSTKANTHLLSCPEFLNEEYKSEKLRAKRMKTESTLDTTVKNMEQYDLSFASLRDKLSSPSDKGDIAKLLGIPSSIDTALCDQVAVFVHEKNVS